MQPLCRIGQFALFACAALTAQAVVLLAQQEKPGPLVFEVDPVASRVWIKVGTASRLGHPHGVQGGLKSGKITLGGEGELVFDMASFVADTPQARQRVGLGDKKVSDADAKKVTDAMIGADVLDVARFPTAEYRITSSKPLNNQAVGEPGSYQLEGRFTLHGVQQKLQFTSSVQKTDKPGELKMTGTFTIRQTDYGITPYSVLGGLAKVADELEIFGDLILKAPGK